MARLIFPKRCGQTFRRPGVSTDTLIASFIIATREADALARSAPTAATRVAQTRASHQRFSSQRAPNNPDESSSASPRTIANIRITPLCRRPPKASSAFAVQMIPSLDFSFFFFSLFVFFFFFFFKTRNRHPTRNTVADGVACIVSPARERSANNNSKKDLTSPFERLESTDSWERAERSFDIIDSHPLLLPLCLSFNPPALLPSFHSRSLSLSLTLFLSLFHPRPLMKCTSRHDRSLLSLPFPLSLSLFPFSSLRTTYIRLCLQV